LFIETETAVGLIPEIVREAVAVAGERQLILEVNVTDTTSLFTNRFEV
jgi:hypothetical protein